MRIVEIEPGLAGVQQALVAVHELFEDEQSVALVPAGNTAAIAAVQPHLPTLDGEPALVLVTSGSAGEPKAVEISLTAIAASAEAAAIEFQGPAVWLTALPVTGIGGLNTVIRSALNGTEPVIWDGVGGAERFDPQNFAPFLTALRRSADKQRMAAAVSLVPTQVARIAEHDLSGLAALDFVLVGGAGLNPELKSKLLAAKVKLITTYGATETCGGVWWNQKPLGDTEIEIAENGEILISGSLLASRYRDGRMIAPQWHTGDLGELTETGLSIQGRLDRVIKTNGHKISLDLVTKHAQAFPGVAAAFAVGLPDSVAGHFPVVAYVGDASETELQENLRTLTQVQKLSVVKVSELPLLLNGKPDSAEIQRVCETSLS